MAPIFAKRTHGRAISRENKGENEINFPALALKGAKGRGAAIG
jgi:hypothetical protein